MSYSYNSRVQPLCTFCKNAGKSINEYSTHTIKCCDALRNTLCKYCQHYGHTIKYCEIKQRDDVRQEKQIRLQEENQKKEQRRERFLDTKKQSSLQPVAKKSAFICLDDSDEDADASKSNMIIRIEQPVKLTFAQTLAKAPEPVIMPAPITRKASTSPVPKKKVYTNWADDESSSDEDED